MNFSFEHGFETDRVFLNRKSEEQGRINERLRNEFRAESARRCDADLAERWAKQELDMREDDRKIEADFRAKLRNPLLPKGQKEDLRDRLVRMEQMGRTGF